MSSSGDRLRLLGAYGGGSGADPEPVEMMVDDHDSSTSNDSDIIDDMKSENSETTKQDSNDVHDEAVFNSIAARSSLFNDTNNNKAGILNSNGMP